MDLSELSDIIENMNDYTLLVADHLRNQARWRRLVSEKYPQDEDSGPQADMLDAAARKLEEGDDSSALVQELIKNGMFSRGAFSPSEEIEGIIRRFGRRYGGSSRVLFVDMYTASRCSREGRLWINKVQGQCTKRSWRMSRVHGARRDRDWGPLFKVQTIQGIRVLGSDDAPVRLTEVEDLVRERRPAQTPQGGATNFSRVKGAA